MAQMRATFRGLFTEIPVNALPSGVADDILNTVFEGTALQGRKGFALWDGGSGSAVLNLHHVRFANGEGYNVKKCADGYLYFQADTGGDWTKIATYTVTTDDAKLNILDPGWFYFWSDRLYYFDRDGSVKWNPDDGTWKAGVDSTVGPATLSAAAGGEKEGYYHVHVAKWNSVTDEISRVTGPQTPGVTTRLSEGFGGIAILGGDFGEWDDVEAADLNYEWNRVIAFCTKGDTEFSGLGDGAEKFSYVAIWDADVVSDAGNIGLNKADSVLVKKKAFTNTGGLPPSSRHGFFNGSRAVYLDIYVAGGGDAEYGKVMFSVPRFPTMVPQKQLYELGGDSNTVMPKPWTGELRSIMPGDIMGSGAVGEKFVVFTQDGIFWLIPLTDGRLYPVAASRTMGCVSETGVVSTLRGVHALSRHAWIRVTDDGVENIAYNRFTPTLKALPATQTGVVAGSYTFRNEIWMAVPNSDGYVQDILIWNEARNEIVSTFTIEGLGTASIKCMVEIPSTSGPLMLLGLSDGMILQWPGTTYYDNVKYPYDCWWQGWFGQERRVYDQHLLRLSLDVGVQPASGEGITVAAAGVRTPSELNDTVTMVEKIITKEKLVDHSGVEFDPNLDGNMFCVRISSTKAQGADWSIDDMILHLDRVSK